MGVEGVRRTSVARAAPSRARTYVGSAQGALLLVGGAMMLANMYLIFMWAPTEATLGHVQRIFYVHVPMAWVAFLAFLVVFIGSILYLWKRESKWDMLASSAAEIGVVFTSLVIITGPIWAKPVWGIWWTWDARLTTTLVLWLIYVAYLMLRSYSANRSQGAVYSAVLGVVGFVDVPIIYFAVDWWETQHRRLVVGFDGINVNSDMRIVLYFSVLTFVLLFGYLLWQRVSMKRTEEDLRASRRSTELARGVETGR